jgi:hypothetical protein
MSKSTQYQIPYKKDQENNSLMIGYLMDMGDEVVYDEMINSYDNLCATIP